MHLFQHTILKKQIASRIEKIQEAYKLYAAYFLNPAIQENIRNSKEEQFQEGFLRELFVKILGYTLNPEPDYNLITEKKNETNSKKADGAILINGEVKAVIELKDHKTTDLKQVETQAFGYKNNNRKTSYVIISNFEKLRFYIDNTIDFVEFNLFNLTFDARTGASPVPTDDFAVLWICLAYENIAKDLPKQLKNESVNNEDRITKQLYKDYSAFKQELYADIVANQQGGLPPCHYDQLTLFKKTQKLLDRLLFIFFAEDGGLLPPNSMSEIIVQWEKLNELDEYRPLYDRIKKYFGYVNTGFKGKKYDVFPYNGGLFKPDEVLDNVVISDKVLRKHALKLSQYDFASEVDVNILGHIFEHSLTEIEEITREHAPLFASFSKRKKDGVFYTPRYITTYIVENTLGKLCADKKLALEIAESEYYADKKRQKATTKKLADKLDVYRNWLLSLTICDPACGSGAFLNAALDFLMNEHRLIDEMTAKIFGSGIIFPNIENAILENNLYGVDINEESVEIARLALWLRTAKPQRKLNSLNNNIKCGNSLISPTTTNNGACLIAAGNSIAGNNGASPIVGSAIAIEKAFDWHTEFPQVFKEKQKQAFHVTWVTYNSRLSQRVIDYKVMTNTESVYLSEKEELIVTQAISEIINEDDLNCIAYNICGDHVHILLVCEEEELTGIVRKMKSVSARKCNIAMGRTIPHGDDEQTLPKHGETQYQLWAQKFDKRHINNDEQLVNTITYIKNNRLKHRLPTNNGACPIVTGYDESTTNNGACPIATEHDAATTNNGACPIATEHDAATTNNGACLIATEHDAATTNNGACLIATETDDSTNTMGQAPLLVAEIESMTCAIDHAFRTEYKGGFDVVIGNPPYGAKIDKNQIAYLSQKYAHWGISSSLNDTYFVFYAMSLEKIVATDGYLGFITPNTWKLIDKAKLFRKVLFGSQYRIVQIVQHLNKVFEDATVDCDTLIINKSHNHADNGACPIVTLRFMNDSIIEKEHFLAQTILENQDYINPFLTQKDYDLKAKILSQSQLVKDELIIKNGVKPYEKGKGKPAQTDYTMKEKPFTSEIKKDDTFSPLIGGSYFNKYKLLWNNNYWIQYGEWLAAPREKGIFEVEEKLIFRQTSDSIIGTFIGKGFIMRDNTHIILNKENSNYNLKYVLAILNSKMSNYFYWTINPEKGEAMAQVKAFHLGLLPIKNITLAEQQPFIALTDQMLSLNTDLQCKRQRFLAELKKQTRGHAPLLSLKQQDEWEEYFNDYKSECNNFVSQIEATDKEIDRLVYGLYGLTEEEIRVMGGKR